MVQSPPASSRDTPSESARRDDDGNHIHNEILLELHVKNATAVLSKLDFVGLKLHQVLHEPGERLKSGYFCNSGMFSVLSVMPDGNTVEVGLIGKEGFSGVPLVAGPSEVVRPCLVTKEDGPDTLLSTMEKLVTSKKLPARRTGRTSEQLRA